MEKDQKEKVIGSWPRTCIQYTRLHNIISISSSCTLTNICVCSWTCLKMLFTVYRSEPYLSLGNITSKTMWLYQQSWMCVPKTGCFITWQPCITEFRPEVWDECVSDWSYLSLLWAGWLGVKHQFTYLPVGSMPLEHFVGLVHQQQADHKAGDVSKANQNKQMFDSWFLV